jgi:formylglycine-generating enzyme required for sulfatase activity
VVSISIMFRLTGFLLAVTVFLSAAGSSAGASQAEASRIEEKSGAVALVIGNAAYQGNALGNPLNDAGAMSGALAAAGFDVTTLLNAETGSLREALTEYRKRLSSGGTGFIYFAGHGADIDGEVFILPTDARTADIAALRATAVSLTELTSNAMSDGRTVILLDICRTNPFAGGKARATAADIPLPAKTLLSIAASPAQEANDGASGQGLFTQAVLRALATPQASLEDALLSARDEVRQVTAGRQVPTVAASSGFSSRTSRYERALLESAVPEAFALAQLRPVPGRNRGIQPKKSSVHDLEFWNAIKDSTDAADYEAYLESFPGGSFAPLARLRIRQFNKDASVGTTGPDFKVKDMEAPYTVLANTNVRALPTAVSEKVGELTKGSRINVTGQVVDTNWYRIWVDGKAGYIFGDLITSAISAVAAPKEAPAPAPAAAPAPVTTPAVAAVPQPAKKAVSKPEPAVVKAAPPAAKKPAASTGAVAALTPRAGVEPSLGLKDCELCPVLVRINPGSFVMGSNAGNDSERPATKVTIRKSFEMGKYEISVGEWGLCAAEGGCSFNPGKKAGQSDRAPMRNLSWFDAMEYVTWIRKKTGRAYRLPSEAEWEYATRAGTTSRFWWGDDIGKGLVDCKDCGSEWARKAPPETGSFAPNAFGLHDTSGSVWEWTADCWNHSHDGAPRDGSVRDSADCRQRVLRGGSWRNEPDYLRSASRFNYDVGVRYLVNGFRVAVTLE